MNKVDLSGLPKTEKQIKWKSSIGMIVKFEYNNILGEFIIVDYIPKSQKLQIRYNNKSYEITTQSFCNCQFGSIFGRLNSIHKFKIGDILTNLKSGKLKIIDKIRMENDIYLIKGYKYECVICGNVDDISEANLLNKRGCNVCSGQKVLKGYNDLYTTHPHVAELINDKQIGYKVSHGNQDIRDFSCPSCKSVIRNKRITNVVKYGLSCPKCSDGISYPEKFMFNLLDQLKINFEIQHTFDWLKDRRYDFYIPSLNCIIETHGKQHYEEGFKNKLKDTIDNDNYKIQQAIQNGIDNYIIIDCRRSEMQYIKNSIINSEISFMFNLNEIDWEKCHYHACHNSIMENTCELWKKGNKSTIQISRILKLSQQTVIKYLKHGNELGLVNFNPKKNMKKSCSKNGLSRGKPIVRLTKNNVIVDTYNSASEASRMLKYNQPTISTVCRGEKEFAYGFKWMYKEDYEKYIKQNKQIS